MSFALNGMKKRAFTGFWPRTQPKARYFIKLVKYAITECNLDLKNIVGKAFDGAANMNDVPKGLSTRMEECYGGSVSMSTVTDMYSISPFSDTD